MNDNHARTAGPLGVSNRIILSNYYVAEDPGPTAEVVRLVLRVSMITGAAISTLALLATAQIGVALPDLLAVFATFTYFIVGLVIVFKELRLWLRSILAVLLHLPVAFLLARSWEFFWPLSYVAIAYGAVWVLFLITQSNSLRSIVKDELHYYLLD